MAKENDIKKKTFVLSDESVNSYGFRVLTDGIALDNFKKNPVMLWNHTRTWTDRDNAMLPIGRWNNVRVEDGRLLADAEFDMDDPFAAKIARKVEKGILNMCSIGIVVVEDSEDPEFLVKGQTRRTVTKCRLREASVVDIGANANAVVLYDTDGNIVELNADGGCAVALINQPKSQEMELKKIALQLGLSETATEAEVEARIAKLNAKPEKTEQPAEVQQLKDRIAALENEKQQAEDRRITELVDQAVSEQRITADKKNHFVELGKKVGSAELKATLDCMNPAVKPTDFIGKGASVPADKKFSEMSESDLKELREKDPAAYATLYEKEFGFMPDMD
ncbi:MAG: HK97 family phage prohead protease [Bacteroidales bacterium]|nr:HK97 family phage prohead protease [Bacteroidales bacterium]